MLQPVGPSPCEILIIMDYPTAIELKRGELLSGPGGPELERMFKDAGLLLSQALVVCFSDVPPPKGDLEHWLPTKKKNHRLNHTPLHDKHVDSSVVYNLERLEKLIAFSSPKVIVPMGALSLWALTAKWGLKTYRGSVLSYNSLPVIPTYAPAFIFTMWSQRFIAVQDLRRIKNALDGKGITPPKYNFSLEPSFEKSVEVITSLQAKIKQEKLLLSVDIETRSGHITCIGFAWSKTEAICIPFVRAEKGSYPYWSLEEESQLIYLLSKLLTHPNCLVITQNGNYDFSYIYKAWHFIPNHYQDTMVSSHCCFTTIQKSLDFLASLYAEYYLQWKGEMRGQFKLEEKNEA